MTTNFIGLMPSSFADTSAPTQRHYAPTGLSSLPGQGKQLRRTVTAAFSAVGIEVVEWPSAAEALAERIIDLKASATDPLNATTAKEFRDALLTELALERSNRLHAAAEVADGGREQVRLHLDQAWGTVRPFIGKLVAELGEAGEKLPDGDACLDLGAVVSIHATREHVAALDCLARLSAVCSVLRGVDEVGDVPAAAVALVDVQDVGGLALVPYRSGTEEAANPSEHRDQLRGYLRCYRTGPDVALTRLARGDWPALDVAPATDTRELGQRMQQARAAQSTWRAHDEPTARAVLEAAKTDTNVDHCFS